VAPKALLIVGTGMQAEETVYYLGTLGGHEVDAFLLDPEYLKEPTFLGRPVLAFDDARVRFPAATHALFVAIGMTAMQARRRWFLAARDAGYALPTYVHPSASVARNVVLGANTIVKDLAVVSPFATLGHDLILCPQVNISHHARLGSHGFYAPGAIVSGSAVIGEGCFVGAGAIVRDRVSVGDGCIIGAGAVVMEDCAPHGVYRAARTSRTRTTKE
jgi:sugar O-acyltransferase (sialic acid O-acetyltransferase NeuD family)